MNEKIDRIILILGSIKVDGMENHEKIVYLKMLLEQLKEKG